MNLLFEFENQKQDKKTNKTKNNNNQEIKMKDKKIKTQFIWTIFVFLHLLFSVSVNGNPAFHDVIHRAVANGNIKKIKELIKLHGYAAVNARNVNTNMTVLMEALKYNQTEIAELLIDNGANVNAQDRNHTTPLIYAVDEGLYDMAEKIIKEGANIDQKDKNGKTALIHSVDGDLTNISNNPDYVRSRRRKIAHMLIARGADLNAKENGTCNTPLKLAKENKITSIADLIRRIETNPLTCPSPNLGIRKLPLIINPDDSTLRRGLTK